MAIHKVAKAKVLLGNRFQKILASQVRDNSTQSSFVSLRNTGLGGRLDEAVSEDFVCGIMNYLGLKL